MSTDTVRKGQLARSAQRSAPTQWAARRYDIDAIRVIALMLLVVYHITIAGEELFNLYLISAFGLLNIWRIPILFLVSGMAVSFLLRRRNASELVVERTLRILVPLVFGYLVINPLSYISPAIVGEEIGYFPHYGHLWFLVFIFIYAVVLGPAFYYLNTFPNNPIMRAGRWLAARPYHLMGVFVAMVTLEGLAVNPEWYPGFEAFIPPLGDFGLHGPLVGIICFVAGYAFISAGERFWGALLRIKFILPAVALGLFALRATTDRFSFADSGGLWEVPPRLFNTLQGLEASLWMLSALALALAYLNRPSRALAYLTLAVFPVYIFHEPFQIFWGTLLEPLELPAIAAYILLLLTTFASSFILFELVRRIPKVRLVFGLRA